MLNFLFLIPWLTDVHGLNMTKFEVPRKRNTEGVIIYKDQLENIRENHCNAMVLTSFVDLNRSQTKTILKENFQS